MADAQVSKTCGDNTPCGFDSLPRHTSTPLLAQCKHYLPQLFMPIKETEVKTHIFGFDSDWHAVKVFYTDELTQTSIYDLARNAAARNGKLPYLFVGHFSDNTGFSKWFFSNARRHQEMYDAITADLNLNNLDYCYGQLNFDERLIDAEGSIMVRSLLLHSRPHTDPQVEKRILRELISKLRKTDLRSEVDIYQANELPSEWGYTYYKETDILEDFTVRFERRKKRGN